MVDVRAGGMHTVAITEDGKVFTWGCNDEGALGRIASNMEEESIPGNHSNTRDNSDTSQVTMETHT